MDQEQPDEGRADENVVFDEDGTPDTANYRKQPSSATENHLKGKINYKKWIKRFAIGFVTVVLTGSLGLFVFVLHQGLSFFSISGNSMYPTLKNGDAVILKQSNAMSTGDIIFFTRPAGWDHPGEEGNLLVKRVAAIEGQILSFNGAQFKVNDKVIYTLPKNYDCSAAPQNFSVMLNDTQVFVLGDNALDSFDSRKMFCEGKVNQMFVPYKKVKNFGTIIHKF